MRDLSTYNVEAGLEKASEGATLKDIAAAMGCSVRQLSRLKLSHPPFSQALRQARETGFEVLADRYRTLIADNPFAEVDALRLEFDIGRWYLSKLYAAVFGDRLAVQVEHVDIAGALGEARERKARIINETPDRGAVLGILERVNPFEGC